MHGQQNVKKDSQNHFLQHFLKITQSQEYYHVKPHT